MSQSFLGRLMLDLDGSSLTQEENKILLNPHVGGVILFARNISSRGQVQEGIEGESSLTLKYDSTAKTHLGHLTEVEIATTWAIFLTGIRKKPSGTAQDYVQSI